MAKRKNAAGAGAIATNRRARRDYHLHETYEAGLELLGSEVKSVRNRKVSIEQSYGRLIGGELFVVGMHVAEYEQAGPFTHKPLRPRKLLLHRREIGRIAAKITQKGFTLVPTRLYFSRGYAKLQVAIATGKRKYDKREDIRRRDAEREMRREMKRVKHGRDAS